METVIAIAGRGKVEKLRLMCPDKEEIPLGFVGFRARYQSFHLTSSPVKPYFADIMIIDDSELPVEWRLRTTATKLLQK